jgi:hypothetical protein
MTNSGWCHFGINGAGDLIGCLPDGRHLEVETKAGMGGRLSVAQQQRMRQVSDHNGVYVVVHSVQELTEVIAPYLQVNDEVDSDFRQCGAPGTAEDGDDEGRPGFTG